MVLASDCVPPIVVVGPVLLGRASRSDARRTILLG